jgi:hypothetical protein
MPRSASSAFLTALSQPIIRPAFLVQAGFASGPVYLWTGRGSLTWNGQTWLGTGSQGIISTIEEGSTVEAKGITLSLSGIDPSLLTGILTEFQLGLPCFVYFALFDGTPALIPDPIPAFAGRMDQPTIDVDGSGCTITIAVESRLMDMNVSAARRYTQEDQQRDHPNDQAFNFVPALQEVSVLYWGRLPSSRNNA